MPDFFILGAPKCGTTSLAAWLGRHPQVFMPRIKEPHFFNTDSTQRDVFTERDYHRLFRDAGPQHHAVGEASVYYLCSSVAVANIERALPEPRYVVLLRNPVDMAPALHEQKVYSGDEHVRDFETAWRLQDARREGKQVSRDCRDPQLLVYGDVCRLGGQLQRLYRTVPRDRVLPLLLDDLREDAPGAYRLTLDFLGVPDDGRRDFPVENAAKTRRMPGLQRVMRGVVSARRAVGIPSLRTGIMPKIDRLNRVMRPRAPLPAALRVELAGCFAEDIALLADLLGRDLGHWLVPADA